MKTKIEQMVDNLEKFDEKDYQLEALKVYEAIILRVPKTKVKISDIT